MNGEGRLQVLEAQEGRPRAAGNKLEQLAALLVGEGLHHLTATEPQRPVKSGELDSQSI